MKKVISFIVALVLILAGVVSFAGCEDLFSNDSKNNTMIVMTFRDVSTKSYGSDPQFTVRSYVGSVGFGSYASIIDSVETLREMVEQHRGGFFDETSICYEDVLGNRIRGYDSDYFKDNEILFIVITLPHYENRELKNVELVEEKVVVTIEKPNYDKDVEFAQVITDYVFIAEVEKSIGQREIIIETVEAK